MKTTLLLLPLLFLLFALAGCSTPTPVGPDTPSHTGAENSQDYIENEEINVVAKSAVQFGILALHQGETEAATLLRDDLDVILADFPAGPDFTPDEIMSRLRQDLSDTQEQRLSAELASVDRHLSGKLANGTIIDTVQSYMTLEYLQWIREAADFASRGYNINIVRSHGIVTDQTKFNPKPAGVVIGLDFLNRDDDPDDRGRAK